MATNFPTMDPLTETLSLIKAALERLGPTPLHRKSYRPVAQALLRFE